MKIIMLVSAVVLFGGSLRADVAKSFPDGYIVCVFDQPATITNEGSKLRVGVLDPASHRWVALPFSDDSGSRRLGELVVTDNSTDEVHSGGTLTIKKPATIVLWNFKGSVVDVEFSVLPKHMKRLSHLPQPH